MHTKFIVNYFALLLRLIYTNDVLRERKEDGEL